MKGMLNARGQVLRLDLPDQWLGGVEHENQRLLVAQHRLDGLEMQLDLVRPQNKRESYTEEQEDMEKERKNNKNSR